MASRKVLGNVSVKVDGMLVKAVPDSVEVEFGGYPKESMSADNQIHFRDGPLKASMLKCKLLITKETNLAKLNNLDGGLVEIITDLDGGITWPMEGATRTGDPLKASSSDGQLDFQCEGDPIQDAQL